MRCGKYISCCGERFKYYEFIEYNHEEVKIRDGGNISACEEQRYIKSFR